MSTSSMNFDLKELVGDLLSLVKDRAKDAAGQVIKPDAERIKSAVLSAIVDDAKNVTEIIRALSLSSAGTWNPTNAEVQQTLNALLDEKLASSKVEGDRKVYSITKAGKTALKNAPEANETTSEGSTAKSKFTDNLTSNPEFLKSASKLGPVMLDLAKTGSPSQQKAAAALLDETRHKLHQILAEK
ncbi:MAG: PadR family transcriptional regulator [Rhodoluna sp.]